MDAYVPQCKGLGRLNLELTRIMKSQVTNIAWLFIIEV
jgi:hypothetical protein